MIDVMRANASGTGRATDSATRATGSGAETAAQAGELRRGCGMSLALVRVVYDLERGEVPCAWAGGRFRSASGCYHRGDLLLTNRRLIFAGTATPTTLALWALARVDVSDRFDQVRVEIEPYDEAPVGFSGRGRRMRRLAAALAASVDTETR